MSKASLPGDPQRQQQQQQQGESVAPTVFDRRQLKQAALNQAVVAAEVIEESFTEYFEAMMPELQNRMMASMMGTLERFGAAPVRYVSLDEWERKSIGGAAIDTQALPGQ